MQGVEVGGDLILGSTAGGMNINGNVVVGGDVSQLSGGTIQGDVIAGGMIYLDETMTVLGDKLSGVPFESILDHYIISDFFMDTSTVVGGWEATGTVTNNYNELTFNGTSGVNVVDIDADTLYSAWKFNINAPSDAVVYINVRDATDQTVALDWTDWTYNGGITPGNVLLNMPGIGTLNLSSSNAVNILAPLASTTFEAGLVTGSLIVGDLQGGGQVNLGHFNMGGPAEGIPTPEPGTMAMLLVGLPGFCTILARRKKNK
jgi:choice-of-anchor A domain-containing protein